MYGSVGLGLVIVEIMAIFGLIIITPIGISNSYHNTTNEDMHKDSMNMNILFLKDDQI
jgi:virulence-associated protein VagC